MKQITDIIMSKQFLIGLGVGIAGVYAYKKFMTKETTSSADGRKMSRGALPTQKSCCQNPETGEIYYITQVAGSTSFPCADGHRRC